jgi:hypothetical protein
MMEGLDRRQASVPLMTMDIPRNSAIRALKSPSNMSDCEASDTSIETNGDLFLQHHIL